MFVDREYALFSRAGFSPALQARARDEQVPLVDPERLLVPVE